MCSETAFILFIWTIKFNKNILLKIETDASITKAKNILFSIIEKYKELKDFRSVRINIDVDPY